MKAELLHHTKKVNPNGDTIEIKIWKVPVSEDKPFGVKYSLVFVRDGKRIICYDNAERKGDHKHIGDKELSYKFTTVKKLFKDFYRDIEEVQDES
ncbi:hypothetical protein C4544_07440 [candidate division WS5 bacterium]|uniref:Uncharacterized protein n=1 Tax=candidate division WS5 bacterium TaxID=2093353 RepID=A0A419D9Q6_9BACT|nr:MAG: hypothetical protein C4544_07440 [candidate division WS5 bacterium]